MAVKIRLQRHGKKGKPFYHIVVADARSPRDGRFIDRIGSYNPNTDPATIELDTDVAVKWLNDGAQPTDTVRAILGYKGALYQRHLDIGVKKGAITPEDAAAKLEAWKQEKANKIDAKKDGLSKKASDNLKAQFDAEAKIKNARLDAINAKKLAAIQANAPAETADAAESSEETPADSAE